MKHIYILLLLLSQSLFGQSKKTVLEHLQNGETLRLEWSHQQYLIKNGTKPTDYPLFPDQLKAGEREIIVGLKLEMVNGKKEKGGIKVWIEYVNSVEFPERQPYDSLNLFSASTPPNALIFPTIQDTRYVLPFANKKAFSIGNLNEIPLVVDIENGFTTEQWKATGIDETKSFNDDFLNRFLKLLWQQNWTAKEHFILTEQFQASDRISINFFKPIHSAKLTTISGKILNPIENQIKFLGLRQGSRMQTSSEEILTLNEAGEFTIQVELDEPVIFPILHGFSVLVLYIEPGNHLELEIDALAFYRKTKFKGDDAKANQFLLDFFHQMRGDDVFASLDMNILEKSQLTYLDEIINKEKKELAYLANYPNLNPAFRQEFDRFIRFFYAEKLWYNGQWFYEKRDAFFEPAYLKHCQDLQRYFFRLPTSKNHDFVLDQYLTFLKTTLKGSFTNQRFGFRTATDFELAKMIFSPQNAFRIGRLHLFSIDRTNIIANPIYKELQVMCKDASVLKELEDYENPTSESPRITGNKVLNIGMPAPNFNFQNNGKAVQLSNYKGKYLLLHIGLEENFGQAKEDLQAIKTAIQADFEILSIVAKTDSNATISNQANVIFISQKEMLLLRNNYLIENNANHYYLIDDKGIVIANPFDLNSFQKLKSTIASTLPTTERNKSWKPSTKFLQVFGIVMLGLLLISGVYIQRKRVLVKKEQQRRQIVELELKSIRSQMNPHFLFNALSSIQNLIRKNDNTIADRYLTQFAGLVRKILRNSEQEFITLEEEMAAIRQYCSLEALRASFDYEINIAEEIDVFNTYIPGMLLQPLVENAILHGLLPKKDNRKLEIVIQNHENGLVCEIIDNGIGLEKAKDFASKNKAHQKSFGLALVRQRLKLLSGNSKNNVELIDRKTKNPSITGTIVKLYIPIEE
ncbi:MAG: sensor histidine kinase [Saprospiraceae bacterium]